MAGITDEEALELARAKHRELQPLGLRPGVLAALISLETNCGMDAARLVVDAG